MIKDIDYSLYLVTDRNLSKNRPLIEIIKEACSGGVSIVQLREKEASTKVFLDEALAIRNYLKEKNIPLIINDRIDIALAINADGVHLGQDDMPILIAKKLLPENCIIGISVNTTEEAIQAEKNGADYLGLSPIFSTPTKIDIDAPIGIEGIKAIRKHVNIPLVAIGGINVNNCKEIIDAGSDGIAVVSAIISSDEPRDAAKELLDKIKS